MSNERETRGADSVQRPCSAEMELADQLEMSALQHADNGEAAYGKPLMDAAFALRRLSTALVDANDLCRSAWQISERDGKETEWENFRDCLGESLERQHRVMYPPNEKAHRPERAGGDVEMQNRAESARSGSVQRPC